MLPNFQQCNKSELEFFINSWSQSRAGRLQTAAIWLNKLPSLQIGEKINKISTHCLSRARCTSAVTERMSADWQNPYKTALTLLRACSTDPGNNETIPT